MQAVCFAIFSLGPDLGFFDAPEKSHVSLGRGVEA